MENFCRFRGLCLWDFGPIREQETLIRDRPIAHPFHQTGNAVYPPASRHGVLIRSLPTLSPSPLGLCNLCRGFPARSIQRPTAKAEQLAKVRVDSNSVSCPPLAEQFCYSNAKHGGVMRLERLYAPSLIKRVAHSGEKLLVIKRLLEKRNCPHLHGGPFIVRTFASCHDDYARLTTHRGEACLYFQAGHSIHPNVEYRERHAVHLGVGEESLCFVKGTRRDSIRSQQIFK